jgi:hypothetical protein
LAAGNFIPGKIAELALHASCRGHLECDLLTDRRFARIPESVLLDKNLSPRSILVYAVLSMHVFEGNIACLGQRRIAELAHIDRRRVRESLDSLAKFGHIATAITKLKLRAVYQLNSPIFGQFADHRLGGETGPVVGVRTGPRIDNRSKTRPLSLRRVK